MPFIALLSLFAAPALAWSDHCYVTDLSLVGVELPADVAVEPLEAFVATPGLDAVFVGYSAWLGERGSPRYVPTTLGEPTVAGFLAAARLSPTSHFGYVRRLGGAEAATGAEVALTEVSPVLAPYPPLRLDFVAAGPTMSAHDILMTYVDEPDWGIDDHLFQIEAYGYGEQPYGDADGASSRAPFHMQFAHENGLVRAFAPQVTEGMAVDRAELFVRLSRFAFASGHPYWGWRFAAWSIHYAQDLTQPYHSKALPSVGGGYYVRYVVSPMKDRMQAKATQWAGNRHALYEDYIAYEILRGYTDEDPVRDALMGRLATGEVWTEPDVVALFDRVMAGSAEHSPEVDGIVVKAFGKERTSDWRYDLAADKSFTVDKAEVDPEQKDRLVQAAGDDLERAGSATRRMLAIIQAP